VVADSYGLPAVFFFLPNQFWMHKNHDCVIQALRILKNRGSKLVVAVCGAQCDPRDPEHYPRLQRLVKSVGLEDNFRELGVIPHIHILALMSACTALINPSTFEGWSTTVEEAKALGTPLILSSLNVHREQGSDALFFDANSPENLSDVLESWVPVACKERLLMSVAATEMAAARMKRFADEFACVVELITKNK